MACCVKCCFLSAHHAWGLVACLHWSPIFPKNSLRTDFLESNKLPAFEEFDEVSYYYTPTPFSELMYRSVFEQGQILDAIFTVNTSEKLNFSISRKGLRSLGNYQNYISNSSNLSLRQY